MRNLINDVLNMIVMDDEIREKFYGLLDRKIPEFVQSKHNLLDRDMSIQLRAVLKKHFKKDSEIIEFAALNHWKEEILKFQNIGRKRIIEFENVFSDLIELGDLKWFEKELETRNQKKKRNQPCKQG